MLVGEGDDDVIHKEGEEQGTELLLDDDDSVENLKEMAIEALENTKLFSSVAANNNK